MEKGVKTLSSNWDKWNKVLKSDSLEDVSTVLELFFLNYYTKYNFCAIME